jgi:Zn-dependent metalloprotease
MVKQSAQSPQQTAANADWLIGAGLFTSAVNGVALRSMKDPGSAYDDKVLGKDPQPADMAHYVTTSSDNGGVHINSGIPNRAFYLTAAGIGGFAWEAPGAIWYASLKASSARATFQQFADTTHAKAGELYGTGSAEQEAARAAWREVGIRVTGTPLAARSRGVNHTDTAADGTITARLDQLASQVKALTKEVSGLKKGRS